MKPRHLAISIVLTVVALMSCVAIAAQPKAGKDARASASGAVARNVAEPLGGRGAPSETAAPDVGAIVAPPEVMLKIRDLQLSQANRQPREQELVTAYNKLVDADNADVQSINVIAKDFAEKNHVDGTKWLLDASTGKFVARPAAPEKTDGNKQESSPPKAGTPNSKTN